MRNKHTIDPAALQAWMEKETVLYASQKHNGKQLTLRIRVADAAAIVTHGDDVVFEGQNIKAAAEAYNDA